MTNKRSTPTLLFWWPMDWVYLMTNWHHACADPCGLGRRGPPQHEEAAGSGGGFGDGRLGRPGPGRCRARTGAAACPPPPAHPLEVAQGAYIDKHGPQGHRMSCQGQPRLHDFVAYVVTTCTLPMPRCRHDRPLCLVGRTWFEMFRRSATSGSGTSTKWVNTCRQPPQHCCGKPQLPSTDPQQV